jgi:hypothetical protein
MGLFMFRPAEATFLATVVGKIRNHYGPSQRQLILERIELRLLFPNDLTKFPLNPQELACLVGALQTFSTLTNPEPGESNTITEEEQRQAKDLLKRLTRKPHQTL